MLLPVSLSLLLTVFTVGCQKPPKRTDARATPTVLFQDRGTDDWQDKWFLDGQRAKVTNGPDGMTFTAGPEAKNDTCHAVLWTRQSFSGDLSISYEYTRLDTSDRFVNILYFMATGKGNAEYPTDITAWNHKRVVPHMRTYFNHMKAYHISYAVSANENSEVDDYVRLRRYAPEKGGLRGTAIAPDNFNTGLFQIGVTYRIAVRKQGGRIEMQVQRKDKPLEGASYVWDVSEQPIYDEGRIGLRHMYTRSARYYDFKVARLP